jgi:hypothetical protein
MIIQRQHPVQTILHTFVAPAHQATISHHVTPRGTHILTDAITNKAIELKRNGQTFVNTGYGGNYQYIPVTDPALIDQAATLIAKFSPKPDQ